LTKFENEIAMTDPQDAGSPKPEDSMVEAPPLLHKQTSPSEQILLHNRNAWDRQASSGCQWSQPAAADTIAKARNGEVEIVLTPTKCVPKSWLGEIVNRQVLLLAGGGGQQAPILAAAGAHVTCLDNSSKQLALDNEVAHREQLSVTTILGDMANLEVFADQTFDLVINPCSVSFVPEVQPIWNEAFRVLKPGGRFLAGFVKPELYIFDEDADNQGRLEVKFSLPFSSQKDLQPEVLAKRVQDGETLEFSHTWDALVGGQLRAGFVMIDFFEDGWGDSATTLNAFTPPCFVTYCQKPLPV